MWSTLFLLSLGLAADAAAVAAAVGAAGGRRVVRASLVFGGFQGGMAALGAGLGALGGGWYTAWDHVIALVLLVGLGARAVIAGWRGGDDDDAGALEGWPELLAAAVATSVDALAAGVALPALGLGLATSAGVVGGVTTACCLVSGAAGRRLGERFGRPVQIAGGLVLIGIGVHVYASHTAG
jgi:putative Mn2+ efflux pump MntP